MRNSALIKQPKEKFSFSITPRSLYRFGVFLFLSVIIVYVSIRLTPFLFAPEIVFTNPREESVIVQFPQIVMAGEVRNTHSLTLNGRELYIGKNGIFDSVVGLREGVNSISLEAKNIFGRKIEIVKNVIYIKQ